MRIPLVIEPGNTPILQSVVRDSITGEPTAGATVLVTFKDAGGVLVAGQTWPVALLYVLGSPGVYRCALNVAVAIIVGQSYSAQFEVTVNGLTSTFVYDVDAVSPGGYDSERVGQQGRYPASLLQRLREAEDAYHQLVMGRATASVKDQNGEEVSYSITNRAALAQYIAMLQRQCGQCGAVGPPATVTFGPSVRVRPWPLLG